MALNKDKLVYDETDLASSDQVGAHIIGSGGVKVDSTIDVDGKDALNVHDSDVKAQLVTLNAKDFATSAKQDSQTALLTTIDASLNAIEASAASIDTKVSTAAKQDLQTTELQAVNAELDAQTLSINAIKGKTDQFTFDAGRLAVAADIRLESDITDNAVDTENPFKMGTQTRDGLLAAASASGNKVNVVSDMYRRIYVNDAPNVGSKVSAVSVAAPVTGVAGALLASPLQGRVRIMIQNLGNKPIYIGFTSAVSDTTGLRVSPGAFLEMPFGEDLPIFAMSEAPQDVRVVEIA